MVTFTDITSINVIDVNSQETMDHLNPTSKKLSPPPVCGESNLLQVEWSRELIILKVVIKGGR